MFTDFESLSEFASSVARHLFTVRPNWQQHAYLFEDRDLIVRLRPNRNPDNYVWIASETDYEYVTVGIGPGHAHFSDWNSDTPVVSVVDEAIACVEDVVAGELVGVRFAGGSGGLFDPASLSGKRVELLVKWNQP